MGATLGSIIATIITAHIRKTTRPYASVHSGRITIIRPPPMSITSIGMPAPMRR